MQAFGTPSLTEVRAGSVIEPYAFANVSMSFKVVVGDHVALIGVLDGPEGLGLTFREPRRRPCQGGESRKTGSRPFTAPAAR